MDCRALLNKKVSHSQQKDLRRFLCLVLYVFSEIQEGSLQESVRTSRRPSSRLYPR